VCKEEKAARDECMLFSTAKDPQAACADMVTKYRACMKGFGFDLA
jgi:cytochrome c oxidase assembly protein subunit 17